MKYFNTEYYSSLSHAENSKKRDLGGTSITSEKGTDGKANNSSSYNHEYYMKNKEKWKDNTNTTKEISEFAGLNEDDVKKLKELAMSKGMDSAEYKKLLNQLSKNNPDQAKKIEDALKKDKETGEKEFDLDAAAWDVIRGKYKNGAERRAALGEDYEMVQKRVNELYKEGKVGGGSSGSSSKSTDKKTTTKKATPSKEEKAYKEKSEYFTGSIKHFDNDQNELCHYGILGQKWGVRRFENKDGTLTPAGRKRYDDGKVSTKEKNAFSLKATGHNAMAKVYGMNEKVYSKSNKTLSSMNKEAKEEQLKKANEAQKAANKKREAENKAMEPYRNVDPNAAKNKTTKRVALDYHNMDDFQFSAKYKTTKEKFAKRYEKTQGDTYSLGKKKAAAALAFAAAMPAQYVYIGKGKKLQVTGGKAVAKALAYDTASTVIGTNVGYKKAEQKYASNKK